jgi:hypothetical protein
MYQGADNYFQFSVDEPAISARDGNQVFGKFGLSFGGVSSATSAFSVQPLGTTGTDGRRVYDKNVSYEAMSAHTFKTIFETELFKGKDIVDVSRSTTYTQAMGYTYTVFFRHSDVGENIDLVTANTELLDGDDATVAVTELVAGAQVFGSFQLTFDGYTTGAMAYNVEADAMEDDQRPAFGLPVGCRCDAKWADEDGGGLPRRYASGWIHLEHHLHVEHVG